MNHDHVFVEGCLDLPDVDADHRVRAVLSAALQHAGAHKAPASVDGALWRADFFGLEQCTLFREADEATRARVLRHASQGLIREAWYIEKSGLTYAGKMALSATTTQERMLYNLFGADEAKHFHGVSQWIGDEGPGAPSAFHELLAEVIQTASSPVLVFVIQVILEGWGLRHYRKMSEACVSQEFSRLLDDILFDETKHHGSGALLFSSRTLARDDRDTIIDVLERFLGMVRVGPAGVLSALEAGVGPLDRRERLRVLHELGAEAHAGQRLQFLRSLMKAEQAAPIVSALDARGAFNPLAPEAWV